ncbi:MAG TPA: hypothetical protein VH333_21950 [Pseudonocardiaceae bacterium]|nr:hypothetical protein [Pseudonocardiaceae bacterium]
MREPVSVDPDTYHAASAVFGSDVHAQLTSACGGLESGLSGQGGVAGTDPAGTTWATSYDDTARTVHSLVGDLASASTTLAAMLQMTGFNHGMADSASDPTHAAPTPPDDTVYTPSQRALPELPSAHGGSSGPPPLWWLVEHTVGYVWPNGDPAKLRTAAGVWSTTADAVAAGADYVPEALSAIASQQSPEVEDAYAVCQGMNDHIGDVASACRDLSNACSDFADGIDKAHHDVQDELTSLAEWTAGIEAGGLVVGAFSLGLGEGAAQGVAAARVAATAGRIGKIIQTLIDLAGTVARTIGSIIGKVTDAAERLKVILGVRLSRALTALVAKLPTEADATDAAFGRMSVWAKDWSTRGMEIDSELGGNLPPFFPTIDKFENGVVTSIKSVDLTAPTYQNASALTSKLKGYVDSVADFKEETWGRVEITEDDFTGRALQVAIQPGVASTAQLTALDQLGQYAASKGVQLIISEVP